MKKSVKAILGLSAAVAVLGGGLAALMLTDPSKDNNGEDTENPTEATLEEEGKSVTIISDKNTAIDPETGEKVEGTVKTVDVKNEKGEIHVIQKSKSDDSVVYTIKGYEDIRMNTMTISTFANNLNGLYTEDVIEENCTDLSKFGLANPAITAELTYESGTKYTLLIGNEAPKGGETYVMIKGDNTVYTVRSSALFNFSSAADEFIDKNLMDTPAETPLVNSLRIERKDMDSDIYLEYAGKDDSVYSGGTSASHIMKEPTEAYLSVERTTDFVDGMFSLYASGVYSIHCEESDIAEAGLADPYCTVTMSCDDGNDYKLLMSEPFLDSDNKKSCYLMMEDANVIYTIGVSSVQWLTVEPVDIASTIFIASYVWSVPELNITVGDKDYNITVSQIEPGEKPENPKSSDYKTTLNGKEVDTEHYREFYGFLLSARAESFAIGEPVPSGKPLAVLKYKDSYNKKDYNIEFYDYSNMKALIVVNGESKFLIAKSYVETLKDNAERIDSDEEYVTTWK